MSKETQEILDKALGLSPIERAELVEMLLTSFEFPAKKSIDQLWAQEVEDRIDAYERGEIPTISAKELFEFINKKES